MPIVLEPPASAPLPPPPEDGSFLWELLYEAQGFHRKADAATGYQLRRACEALCAPMQPAWEVLRERADGTPPYGILFDADRCPAELLHFPAMHVGARLTPDMNEAERRAEICEPASWSRGQTRAMKRAIQKTLQGSGRVIVRTRFPAAADIYVRTLIDETPDPALTERVAAESKVAGLVLDYEAIDGVTWADIAAAYGTWDEVSDTFDTWADLADILPDELPEP
jgi:hypothetical protein